MMGQKSGTFLSPFLAHPRLQQDLPAFPYISLNLALAEEIQHTGFILLWTDGEA